MNSLLYVFIGYLTEDLFSIAFLFFVFFALILFMLFRAEENLKVCILLSSVSSLALSCLFIGVSFYFNIIFNNIEIVNEKDLDEIVHIQQVIKGNSYTNDQKERINKIINLSLKNGTIKKYEFNYLKNTFDKIQQDNNIKNLNYKIEKSLS